MACAVLVGSAMGLGEPARADPLPGVITPIDFCSIQAPDATASLPYQGSFKLSSGSAAYANKLCPRYVVDAAVELTPWYAGLGARPDVLLTEATCDALTLKVRVYRQTTTGFALLKSGSFEGNWENKGFPDGLGCFMVHTAGDSLSAGNRDGSVFYTVPAAPATYRVAVSAKVDTIFGSIPVAVAVTGYSPKIPS